jgi:hypothetical protein
LFVDLARRLTQEFPDWLVVKNLDSALYGTGDLDSVAPPRDWPAIEASFRAWAADQGLSPVIVCDHAPSGPYYLSFVPDSTDLFVLDVKRMRVFRANHLFDAEDLLPMAVMDERGFRTLRPGAQGVLKFVWNGIRYRGRPNQPALERKHVRELLESDTEGVAMAVRLYGRGRADVRRAIDAWLAGGWDRPAALRLELRYIMRSIARPRLIWRRMWFTFVELRRCPVLIVQRSGDRRVHGTVDAWLADVARTHVVDPMTTRRASND